MLVPEIFCPYLDSRLFQMYLGVSCRTGEKLVLGQFEWPSWKISYTKSSPTWLNIFFGNSIFIQFWFFLVPEKKLRKVPVEMKSYEGSQKARSKLLLQICYLEKWLQTQTSWPRLFIVSLRAKTISPLCWSQSHLPSSSAISPEGENVCKKGGGGNELIFW